MKGFHIWRQAARLTKPLAPNTKMSLQNFDRKRKGRPSKISIEGNIGSGKSTFLRYFEQFPFVETYCEPLEKWRNVQGHNLLELLYDDLCKWNSTFQSYVQLTRTQIQSSVPKEGVTIQMFERSVQNNRFCFLENAYSSGYMLPEQYTVLLKWYDWIEENVDIALDLIVYLRTSPETAYQRVLDRNRSEEKMIDIKYLENIHKAHEKWLTDPNLRTPVFILDADCEFDEIISSCQKKLPILFAEQNKISASLLGDV